MQLRFREYTLGMKFMKTYVFFGFVSNFLNTIQFLSKEKPKKYLKIRKIKPINLEKVFGLNFTKIYVFLSFHQTFKLCNKNNYLSKEKPEKICKIKT